MGKTPYANPELTFAPRLNTTSLRLAKERESRMNLRGSLPTRLCASEPALLKTSDSEKELQLEKLSTHEECEETVVEPEAGKETETQTRLSPQPPKTPQAHSTKKEGVKNVIRTTRAELLRRQSLVEARRKEVDEKSETPLKRTDSPKQLLQTRRAKLSPVSTSQPSLSTTPNQNRKTFQIFGPYQDIRDSLLARGWVEQKRSNEVSDLIWSCKSDVLDYKSLGKCTIVNHYRGAQELTTKMGLQRNMRKLPWFESVDPDSFFPRCHFLNSDDGYPEFVAEFRHLAARGILRRANTQRLPSTLVRAAYAACRGQLGAIMHDDIDDDTHVTFPEEGWTLLLSLSYRVNTSAPGYLKLEEQEARDLRRHTPDDVRNMNDSQLAQEVQTMLEQLSLSDPQFEVAGARNVWILKPGAKSRGRGITCVDTLAKVVSVVKEEEAREEKWVAQKYIERPLLVHGHKFDIRQWVLVTDWNPLTVWFYKDCYLRFSCEKYSIEELDSKAIHLTNNSIQKHCENFSSNEQFDELMWTQEDFSKYLATVGKPGVWETVTQPMMKQIVTWVFQTTQDIVEARKNSFELYGVDFVLDENCNPWLIEVNSSPCLAHSTSITERLCQQVCEDTIKVVVDNQWTAPQSSCLASRTTGPLQRRRPAVPRPQYRFVL
eukprot:Colp12_sorted_trinity150504_noHs@23638